MSSTDPTSVPALARRQAGVFTAAQARAEGWSSRQVERRRSAGRWHRVAGSGLSAVPGPWTAYQRAIAARLTWPDAIVSHLSAAELHGFPVPCPDDLHVLTHRGRASGRGLRVHSCVVSSGEVVTRGPVRLTNAFRTAADCLATLPNDEALDLWAWLSTRRVMDHPALLSVIAARHHHPGVRRLRDWNGSSGTVR